MTDLELATAAGIPVRVLRAIRSVESHGEPTAVRFEPQLFRRLTGHRYDDQIPYRPDERGIDRHREHTNRAAFERAFALDAEAAVRSSSWGSYQVLGAYLLQLTLDGHSARTAVQGFDADPEGMSERMLAAWFKSASAARRAANADPPDFESFARVYNGPSNVTHYAAALRLAYARAEP